jgi:hypothetical protein
VQHAGWALREHYKHLRRPHETLTALTDDGIEELMDLIKAARLTAKTWYEFLDDFVDDSDLVLRIKAKSPR